MVQIMNNDYRGVVSFRAEAPADLDVLMARLAGPYLGLATDIQGKELQVDGVPVSGMVVQFVISGELTISKLFTAMLAVEDGHVMMETLRALPRTANSMHRRYSKEMPVDWASVEE